MNCNYKTLIANLFMGMGIVWNEVFVKLNTFLFCVSVHIVQFLFVVA